MAAYGGTLMYNSRYLAAWAIKAKSNICDIDTDKQRT